MAKRYVKLPCLALDNGRKIMVTDLKFIKNEDFSDEYSYGKSFRDTTSGELIYDIQAHKFVDSVFIDYYPKLKYKVGNEYLIEQNHHDLKRETLKEIKFNEYESSFAKYKDLYSEHVKLIPDEIKLQLTPNSLIEVRSYKPYYIFESGYETGWDYKFYTETK